MEGGRVASLHLKAESLKAFLSGKKNEDLSAEPTLWSSLQDLQITLKSILLHDLAYALNKKVDLDLWNYGFKGYMAYLEGLKEKRGSLKTVKMNAKIKLTWFLEMASGFYLMLLEELCSTYNLDYPFLGRRLSYGFMEKLLEREEEGAACSNVDPVLHRNNCDYIAQHCLVHLGDLARYRRQIRKAETYYRQAIQISPSSGHAYNQIALLEANRGNKLASVFYYVRSLAVKYPFPAASTNLMTILSRFLSSTPSKIINAATFTPAFLRLEAYLGYSSRLKSAKALRQECNESLTSLIATESLQTWELIQIVAICLFRLEDFVQDSPSKAESRIQEISTEFLASLLNSLLLPVYTTKQGGEPLLEYFGLPVIKILLEWIIIHPWILNQRRFLLKKQIWPGLSTLLNQLLKMEAIATFKDPGDLILPEEFDLQGFLPLSGGKTSASLPSQKTSSGCEQKDSSLLLLRAKRLLRMGEALSSEDYPVRRIQFKDPSFEFIDYEAVYDEEQDSEEEDSDEESSIELEEEEEEGPIDFVIEDEETRSSSGGGILKLNKPEDRLISEEPPMLPEEAEEDPSLRNSNKHVTFRSPSPAAPSSRSSSEPPIFSVPPPPINVPPPLFPTKPEPRFPQHHHHGGGNSSFFGASNGPSGQVYNTGGTYSLFSGPNLLGLPSHHHPPETRQGGHSNLNNNNNF
eukprot:TRINITY_DN3857_c0_g1_i1.p1 TRINITY_DN3857_c0_g1~~TRINITY_DN3857_c0_g1_i1.p1  ORF type:complete len:690 (-),score=224.42 TRINITY_DN3857_c0_g1_i1:107-2176(-)